MTTALPCTKSEPTETPKAPPMGSTLSTRPRIIFAPEPSACSSSFCSSSRPVTPGSPG